MFIIQLCLVFDCCQRLGGFETYRKPVKVLDKSHPLRFFGFLSSGSVSIWCQPQLNGHKTHSTAQQHLPLLYLQTFHLSCLLFPVSAHHFGPDFSFGDISWIFGAHFTDFSITFFFEYLTKSFTSACPRSLLCGVFVVSSVCFKGFGLASFIT